MRDGKSPLKERRLQVENDACVNTHLHHTHTRTQFTTSALSLMDQNLTLAEDAMIPLCLSLGKVQTNKQNKQTDALEKQAYSAAHARTNNKQQTTNNKQQTTNNKQQTTNNKQQTTNNKQQTGQKISQQTMKEVDQRTTVKKQRTTNNKQQTKKHTANAKTNPFPN